MSPRVHRTRKAKTRRISAWHIARLRKAFDRTHNVADAANAAGVSLPTAYRVLADQIRPTTFRTRMRKEALRLYASGLSCRAVALELKKAHDAAPSQESIHQWAKAAGILRTKSRADELQNARRHGRNYDELRKQARHLAEENLWSVRRISEHLGVTRKVVQRAIAREHRLDPSEATERRQWQAYLPDVEARRARRDDVIARREKGQTYPEIVAATGLSAATVFTYCKRAGLTKSIRREAA